MTHVDLKKHRISDVNELNKCRKDTGGFSQFYTAVKQILDSLPEGQKFDILANVPARNHRLFIKAACLYMLNQAMDQVEFTDDYLYIRKRKH